MSTTRDVRGEESFDSRDAIARMKELREEREDLRNEVETGESYVYDCKHLGEDDAACEDAETRLKNAQDALKEWDEENGEELAALESFISEASGYGDFEHGTQCIRDDKFEDHARELAEDIHGNDMRNNAWPFICIDWERAARDLQTYYSSADMGGVTYWFRS